MARPERELRIEAMQALSKIVDDRHAEQLRTELQTQAVSPDQTISRVAAAALAELDNRLAGGAPVTAGTAVPGQPAATRPATPLPLVEASRTAVIDAAAQSRITDGAPRLDIQTLKPGDIIEGRYKYIDRIGRGAFGTVLLMEDTVVDERLILKFLNPNVSTDEEVMKRFVHELRYSRKITHKNVIRIYDFLYIQGNYAISMEYFPAHIGGRNRGRQARQRADQPGGAAEDRGFRCRRGAARGRYPAHQDRLRHRLAEVHGARADPRQEGRRARRYLRHRGDALRDAHGRATLLPGRPHVGHVSTCAGQGPPAAGNQPRTARWARRAHHESDVGGQDQALPEH